MRALALLIVLVLFASGCTGASAPVDNTPADDSSDSVPAPPSDESDELKSFDVVLYHTSIDPSSITVNRGDTVQLRISTPSSLASHNHGLTIDEYDINAVASSDQSNPTVVEFVADKAGTFSAYCKPCWDGPYGKGHPDIRMTLKVE